MQYIPPEKKVKALCANMQCSKTPIIKWKTQCARLVYTIDYHILKKNIYPISLDIYKSLWKIEVTMLAVSRSDLPEWDQLETQTLLYIVFCTKSEFQATWSTTYSQFFLNSTKKAIGQF